MEARVESPLVTARGALYAAAIVLGPALVFWHLHGLWNPDGSYSYGWVVPVLALFLFKFRWDDRPPPSAPARGAGWLAIFFAVLMLPARWLQEAAPERSLCSWWHAGAAVGVSLALLSRAGGRAWLRWFAFPFAFILTAAPWPHGMELLLSNSLMRATAAAAVEILCLIGIPSVQSGNLVHIETGVIDIDEACSGIRSLQAMVMISLFLGELFRLKPGRRVLLMAFGIAATLLANVIRTVALARIGFSRGMGAIDNYHDAAGFAVLLLALAGTLLTAFKLRTERAPAPRATATGLGLPLPVALSGALLIWLCLGEISVEAWYRAHQPEWQGWSWTVSWPRRSEGFHFIDIPRRSLRLLMCDESQAAAWKEPDGAGWSLYWLRWNPGNPQAEAAKVHRPDVCLNAAGAIMENDTGTLAGPAGIPFHSYTFLLGDKTLHVFFCLYEEGAGGGAPAANPHFEGTGMLERALKGRRHIGEQSLELALSGYPSVQSAQAAFEARLGQLMEIRRGAIAGAKE